MLQSLQDFPTRTPAAFRLHGPSTLASRPVAPYSKRGSPSCLLHAPPPALHTCRGAGAVGAAAVAAGGRPGALGGDDAGRWARLEAAMAPGNSAELAALCEELDIRGPITCRGSLLPERAAACLMLGWKLLKYYGTSEPPALAASSAARAARSRGWEADCRRCYRRHKSLELCVIFDGASYDGVVATLLVQLAPSSRRHKNHMAAGLVAKQRISEWLRHGRPGGGSGGGCNRGDA